MVRPPATDPLDARLRGLGRRLVRWSLAEGVAWAALWFAGVAWLAFLVDYFFEPARSARVALLVLAACGIAGALAYFVVWRAVARPSLRAIALLLERRFPELGDALNTAVEIRPSSEETSPALWSRAEQEAERRLDALPVGTVVDRSVVVRRWASALAALGVSAALVAAGPGAARSFADRMFLLSDARYPRQTRLELVGFEGPARKAAKGRDHEIVALADPSGVVPDKLRIRFRAPRTGAGDRGYMTKVGGNRFVYTFRGLLETVDFEVSGGDDRLDWRRIDVVDPPAIRRAAVHVTFPEYTGLGKRTVDYAGSPLPLVEGARVSIDLEANKPLDWLRCGHRGEELAVERTSESSFRLSAVLQGPLPLDVTLQDADGIELEPPLRIELLGQPDLPPRVEAALDGVGPGITKEARVPLRVRIEDDYGLASAAYRLQWKEGEARREPMADLSGKDYEGTPALEIPPLGLEVGSKFTVTVVARDRRDQPEANEGASPPIALEVVSAEELLARLAARELNLRQRFEQVVRELEATRRDLGEARERYIAGVEERPASLLLLDRVLEATRKSRHETAGVAVEYRAVLAELVHNRIQNSRLLERIEAGVVAPLEAVLAQEFQLLLRREEECRVRAAAAEADPGIDAADAAFGELLARCESLLKAMLKLENFNEAVALLRSVIADHERIMERTREERKRRVRELLK